MNPPGELQMPALRRLIADSRLRCTGESTSQPSTRNEDEPDLLPATSDNLDGFASGVSDVATSARLSPDDATSASHTLPAVPLPSTTSEVGLVAPSAAFRTSGGDNVLDHVKPMPMPIVSSDRADAENLPLPVSREVSETNSKDIVDADDVFRPSDALPRTPDVPVLGAQSTSGQSSLPSGVRTPTQSIDSDLGATSKPSITSPTPEEALLLFNAFESKHESMMSRLADVTQLRRQCLHIRRRSGYQRARSSIEMHFSGAEGAEELDEEAIHDASELQELEDRLEKLDEQLLRDFNDLFQAGPRILGKMKKRLPIMLARHQLDFRGDASISSDTTTADRDEDMDATATALLAKQRQLDALEDRILLLRHRRDREVDYLAADEEDGDHPEAGRRLFKPLNPFPFDIEEEASPLDVAYEGGQAPAITNVPIIVQPDERLPNQEQDPEIVETLNREISMAVEELKILKEDLERSLNTSRTPEEPRTANHTPFDTPAEQAATLSYLSRTQFDSDAL